MSDFEKIPDAIDLTEMEAIRYFGEDVIGTKELRVALSPEMKKRVLDFLMTRIHYWAMRTGEPVVMNFRM